MLDHADAIQFLLDEDVAPSLAEELRRRTVNAVHVVALGRGGLSDEDQLTFATAEGRVLLTHNRNDFLRLARAWWDADRHHAGIVYARQVPPGELLRRVIAMLAVVTAGNLRDAVVPPEAFG